MSGNLSTAQHTVLAGDATFSVSVALQHHKHKSNQNHQWHYVILLSHVCFVNVAVSQVRPGIITKDSEGRVKCIPIYSRIVSLFAEQNELQVRRQEACCTT